MRLLFEDAELLMAPHTKQIPTSFKILQSNILLNHCDSLPYSEMARYDKVRHIKKNKFLRVLGNVMIKLIP